MGVHVDFVSCYSLSVFDFVCLFLFVCLFCFVCLLLLLCFLLLLLFFGGVGWGGWGVHVDFLSCCYSFHYGSPTSKSCYRKSPAYMAVKVPT